MQLGVATLEASLDEALDLGGRATALAESSGRAVLISVSLQAEAIVLGALQREASVRELSSARFDGARVVRRRTTGTEAELRGPTLYHALALPKVSSLYADASSRTLLNRNLRAFLRGYAAAGVPFRYFGTEVLSLLGQPVALVGYDKLASGAVCIELLIGLEHPCVVRPALQREPPASLFAALRNQSRPIDFLQRAVLGVAERLGAAAVDVGAELMGVIAPAPLVAPPALAAPPALVAPEFARVSVPIGVVEATVRSGVHVTGDLLTSLSALRCVEALADASLASGASPGAEILVPLDGEPLDGARAVDLLGVIVNAVSLARGAG